MASWRTLGAFFPHQPLEASHDRPTPLFASMVGLLASVGAGHADDTSHRLFDRREARPYGPVPAGVPKSPSICTALRGLTAAPGNPDFTAGNRRPLVRATRTCHRSPMCLPETSSMINCPAVPRQCDVGRFLNRAAVCGGENQAEPRNSVGGWWWRRGPEHPPYNGIRLLVRWWRIGAERAALSTYAGTNGRRGAAAPAGAPGAAGGCLPHRSSPGGGGTAGTEEAEVAAARATTGYNPATADSAGSNCRELG
jgi:hypothetical protein